jgi:hypothetical protein
MIKIYEAKNGMTFATRRVVGLPKINGAKLCVQIDPIGITRGRVKNGEPVKKFVKDGKAEVMMNMMGEAWESENKMYEFGAN